MSCKKKTTTKTTFSLSKTQRMHVKLQLKQNDSAPPTMLRSASQKGKGNEIYFQIPINSSADFLVRHWRCGKPLKDFRLSFRELKCINKASILKTSL